MPKDWNKVNETKYINKFGTMAVLKCDNQNNYQVQIICSDYLYNNNYNQKRFSFLDSKILNNAINFLLRIDYEKMRNNINIFLIPQVIDSVKCNN